MMPAMLRNAGSPISTVRLAKLAANSASAAAGARRPPTVHRKAKRRPAAGNHRLNNPCVVQLMARLRSKANRMP